MIGGAELQTQPMPNIPITNITMNSVSDAPRYFLRGLNIDKP